MPVWRLGVGREEGPGFHPVPACLLATRMDVCDNGLGPCSGKKRTLHNRMCNSYFPQRKGGETCTGMLALACVMQPIDSCFGKLSRKKDLLLLLLLRCHVSRPLLTHGEE